jgi:hypothetical protein
MLTSAFTVVLTYILGYRRYRLWWEGEPNFHDDQSLEFLAL